MTIITPDDTIREAARSLHQAQHRRLGLHPDSGLIIASTKPGAARAPAFVENHGNIRNFRVGADAHIRPDLTGGNGRLIRTR